MDLDQGLPTRKTNRRCATAPNSDTIKVADKKSTAKRTPMEQVAEAEKSGEIPAFLRRPKPEENDAARGKLAATAGSDRASSNATGIGKTSAAPKENYGTKSYSAPACAFAYDELDATVAAALKQQAMKIRDQIKVTCSAIIETGRDLIAVKQQLGHGRFAAWVEAECGFSDRTARRYMRAAEFAADKSDTVSVLNPTTLYMLAANSTPTAVVADVIRRVEAGETVTDENLRKMINGAKDEHSRGAQVQKRHRRWRKLSDRTLRRHEAEQRKREEDRQLRIEGEKARAAEIIVRLGAERAHFLLAVYRDPEIYYDRVFAHLADLLNVQECATSAAEALSPPEPEAD
jgi:Protein of unknown function (DUF3102)